MLVIFSLEIGVLVTQRCVHLGFLKSYVYYTLFFERLKQLLNALILKDFQYIL